VKSKKISRSQVKEMSLSTRLNVDMLLYLLKFLDPVDQCNLVLSGVLEGFENFNQIVDLTER
jgi:hypothetical protein